MVVDVFLKNIPFSASEEDVVEGVLGALTQASESIGASMPPKVGVVSLPFDQSRGRIRGFGFVTLETGDLSAEEAVLAIFGSKVLGRTIHAERFIPKGER